MGLMAVDAGIVTFFEARFNNAWPASKNLTLKLFCNDATLSDADVTGAFTEAVGGGYASKTLTCGNWVVSTAAGIVQAVYPQQIFTFTGVLTTNETVYGYYVIDGNGVLQWAERLDAPARPAANGNHIDITPIFQASKGTVS